VTDTHVLESAILMVSDASKTVRSSHTADTQGAIL